MSQDLSAGDRFWNSTRDAFSVQNVLGTLFKFFAFALLSAFPYVVRNLDKVGEQVSGLNPFFVFLSFLKALGASMFTGMLIAASTAWQGITNFGALFDPIKFGTIFYLLLAIPALVFTVYQPISLIFNWLDLRQGRAYNPILALALTVILTIALAGTASFALDGQTLTSQIKSPPTDSAGSVSTPPLNDSNGSASATPSQTVDLTGESS